MLNRTSVDRNCNGYVPQTEKNISFEARYRAKNCLIFFHTEVFKAYIVLKTLPFNFIVDLPQTVRF